MPEEVALSALDCKRVPVALGINNFAETLLLTLKGGLATLVVLRTFVTALYFDSQKYNSPINVWKIKLKVGIFIFLFSGWL